MVTTANAPAKVEESNNSTVSVGTSKVKSANSKTSSVAVKTIKMTKATKAPIKRVSRTTMVKLIEAASGRFFTSTHIDKENNPRTMNCIKKKGKPTELGYITVWVPKEKDFRNINPQTLTELVIDGTHYKVK
jgi:hypothetical protein